jgi:ribonucleoside-diphosphate reductase alpha chain
MDVIGTLTSMGLQYGVPLEVFVNKFAHSRFEPSGYTHNSDLPIAKSLADYIFRWLGITFLPDYRAANVPQRNPEPEPQPKPPTAVPLPLAYEALGMASGNGNGHANGSAIPFPLAHAAREPRPGRATIQLTGPMCPACNMIMVPSGARCFKCENCGNPGPCG